MKKSFPTLLATMVWTALYSQQTLASLAEQCLLGVPMYDKPLVSGDPNTLPVNIDADKSDVNYPKNAVFTGNVDIQQGNRRMLTQRAEIEQTEKEGQSEPIRTVTATGDVRYSDNQIKINGPKAWSNLNTKDTDVYEGDYQMVGRQGRGTADKMKVREDNRYTILDNGTFTSCLPGDNSWSVVGSEVIYDREEEVAEIWNARFKLGPVPVFYSPYLQLPIGDKRRSGFLIPNAKYSSDDGFEFILPFYWNIAPNYDATITPHYISRRGLQLQTEFRYLTAPGAGTMELDWLGNDKRYSNDTTRTYEDNDDTRWLFYWAHNGVLDKSWRFNVDYTKVSDPLYFRDLETIHGTSTDGYASQKFSVGYAQENWNATLAAKKFQVFSVGGGNQNSYRAEPQLALNYYKNDIGPFDFRVYAQAAKFTSENKNNPKATRFHIEPAVNLPLSNDWGSLNTELKMLATKYNQDIPDTYIPGPTRNKLDSSVTRVLPELKIDGKMVFDREMWLLDSYTQTMEPRVQYIYRPYRDQSNIFSYDTTQLQTDYTGLFRDSSFSGLDRIASANQVAAGITSRIYDEELVERFNASVGQIYYFEQARTGDTLSNFDKNAESGSIAWAGDTFWRLSPRWALRGGVQYDTRIDSLTMGNAIVEYRQDRDRMIQLSYRYASPEYIAASFNRADATYNQPYQDGISQVGGIGSWPLIDNWAFVGAYYYDTKRQQTADSLLGVQYNTCCWAITLGYERKLNGWNTNQTSIYDNKFSFNIELRGLSSNYNLGTRQMLSTGILPYQRAF